MKKSIQVNINGSVFFIDEDAFDLLNNYLNQLHKAFPGEEGAEITSDIEARIAEHFAEGGNTNITIVEAQKVIELIGSPADLAAGAGADSDTGAGCGPAGAPAPDVNAAGAFGNAGAAASAAGTACPPPPPVKKLYRDERDKVFGGVISGLGAYLGWNVTIMRVIYVILCCVSYFWPLFILYMVGWMVIPPARTPRQILEMTGTPVNLANVSRTIVNNVNTNSTGNFLRMLGKVIMALLGIVGGAIGLGMIVLFLVGVAALSMYAGWDDVTMLDQMFGSAGIAHPVLTALALMLSSLAVAMPCAAAVWGACCALFNARGASRMTIIAALCIEVLLITGAIVNWQLCNAPIFH